MPDNLKILKPKPFIVFDDPELCAKGDDKCPSLRNIAGNWYCEKFESRRNFWDTPPRKNNGCMILFAESKDK